jgi:hypothetical protein
VRNCIILGSGRSGTSAAAGVMARAGYFMGSRLMLADERNPAGYFEDEEINAINEELLMQVVPVCRSGIIGKYLLKNHMPYGMRWLARIPLNASMSCPSRLNERIKLLTAREPYCFKDPRFSYTLSIWRPFLRNNIYVCVFRNPVATANSILKVCSVGEYPRGIVMNLERALRVWELMYRHILEIHYRQGGAWLFIHYEQLLNGSALQTLGNILDITPDSDFVLRELNHTRPSGVIPQKLRTTYKRLCELARYEDPDSYDNR